MPAKKTLHDFGDHSDYPKGSVRLSVSVAVLADTMDPAMPDDAPRRVWLRKEDMYLTTIQPGHPAANEKHLAHYLTALRRVTVTAEGKDATVKPATGVQIDELIDALRSEIAAGLDREDALREEIAALNAGICGGCDPATDDPDPAECWICKSPLA
jgi:hypothetical protein